MAKNRRLHALPLLLTGTCLLVAGEGSSPTARLTQALRAQAPAMGLGMLDGLRPGAPFRDRAGATHVRYQQTYRGVDVYEGVLLGHLDAAGRMAAPDPALQTGIDLAPATLLPEDRIRSIVARDLPAEGRTWPMACKVIVFPTRFQGGITWRRDARGYLKVDPRFSVGTPRRPEEYRWAYRVSAMQAVAGGLQATEYVVDGLSGEILRKWDGFQHGSASAQGTGYSQYNGTVAIDTTQEAEGGPYSLRDSLRATKPYPDPQGTGWPEWGGVGFQTVALDLSPLPANPSGTLPYLEAQNVWGDGGRFHWGLDDPMGVRGETAAVDAHFALGRTWDYYADVLGRTGGIDGEGGSPISIVHMPDADGSAWDNASWSPAWFVMMYGDGAANGSLTCLDIAAHEMSHGVMSYTAGLNTGEAQGLNEANSDIHATMVKFYLWGAGGKGAVVPDATTDPVLPDAELWSLGAQASPTGTPTRWLYRPSKDGLSPDAWFDGIALEDPHFSMGPASRAFYFLSRGASADPAQDTASAYLPAGMAGLGNDKAIRIWYHGMATKVADPHTDYRGLRVAMVAAAEELYGAGGPEAAAVRNAFAAINVGAPQGGKEPVQVVFPEVPHSPFVYPKVLVAPALEPVKLPVPRVANAADTGVEWSLGGLNVLVASGGHLQDGWFTAPMVSEGYGWPVKAASHEDPRRFAVDMVFGVGMDCDSDTETDACDLGALALANGGVNVYPAANLYGSARGVDDICLELFLEGFRNAFNP